MQSDAWWEVEVGGEKEGFGKEEEVKRRMRGEKLRRTHAGRAT